MTIDATDRRFMQAALNYGRRHMGAVAPNPAVGALVVREGVIIGRGATQPGGRPHAETEALREAGARAQGATLYVTLEPCSHTGQTPPCAEAIIAAGIARVVCAVADPDPRVAGQGYARLRAAGIDLVTGVMEGEARRVHRGHILRVTQGRPMVTLKLACTADGYAAGGAHDPRLAITGHATFLRVHRMRHDHEAIMVGIGTILADDSLLTVRLPGIERQPLRIVLDPQLRLPLTARLVATARQTPVLVCCGPLALAERQTALEQAGIEVMRLAETRGAQTHGDDSRPALGAVLQALGARGITRVFSEGGPTIARQLIGEGLADHVIIIRAPRPLCHEGVVALDEASLARLADPRYYQRAEHFMAGVDEGTGFEACWPDLI
jgi:diaminohydroxyphosphoribosylaminopyrimidine deaminase/5-amino-6-(5-phosphoribosylamino)uracil reductase